MYASLQVRAAMESLMVISEWAPVDVDVIVASGISDILSHGWGGVGSIDDLTDCRHASLLLLVRQTSNFLPSFRRLMESF